MSPPARGSMWRSLRVRNYRLFASGQVVSLTGTWMQRVAQDWLVVLLSHNSGVAVGITTALQFLPMLLFGLYGGVLSDRLNKRRLLVITQSAQAVLALSLGLLDASGAIRLWQVYLLAFLLGCATSIDNPTRQAFVSELVGPALVPNAVSLNSATFNIARVIGPAVAGFMINAIGTAAVFLANAATFVAVIAGLLLIRESELHLLERVARARGQLRAGLAYVRNRPELLLPIVLVGIVGTFGFNFQLTMALIAKGVFHKGAGSYGLLSTAFALGALGGALLAARRSAPRMSLLVGSAVGFSVLEIAVGLTPTYLSFLAVLVPTGVCALTFTTSANSLVQLAATPAMRGRVMALYLLVFLGGTPFGAPVIGWIAEVLGARYSLLIGGAVSLLGSLAVAVALARVGQLHLRVSPRRVRAGSQEVLLDEARSVS